MHTTSHPAVPPVTPTQLVAAVEVYSAFLADHPPRTDRNAQTGDLIPGRDLHALLDAMMDAAGCEPDTAVALFQRTLALSHVLATTPALDTMAATDRETEGALLEALMRAAASAPILTLRQACGTTHTFDETAILASIAPVTTH